MECFIIFVMAWCWLNATESKPQNVSKQFRKKMKSGTISIIFGALGILFIVWFNYQTYELYQTEFLKIQNSSLMEPTIVTTGKSYKLIALGIVTLGILFGVKSMREKSSNGKIGIVLSLIALILTFIPVWTFFIK